MAIRDTMEISLGDAISLATETITTSRWIAILIYDSLKM